MWLATSCRSGIARGSRSLVGKLRDYVRSHVRADAVHAEPVFPDGGTVQDRRNLLLDRKIALCDPEVRAEPLPKLAG
jgi:hypothetical protein